MLEELLKKINLTPKPIHVFSAGITDVGQRREHNEDNFLIDESLGLFIVADGMGGHEAGEVASKLAIKTVFKHLKEIKTLSKKKLDQSNDISSVVKSLLQDAVEEANSMAYHHNSSKGHAEGHGMGTTLTGFLISALNSSGKKRLYSFNVGDSRIYSFRENRLAQLSVDHSHYQLWLDTGQEGSPPTHNIIYKAIGPWRKIVAEQHSFQIHSGEIFLLCSDGLSDMLSDAKIQSILKHSQTKTLKERAQKLIDAANQAGGKDNITVVLVKPSM